MMENCWAKLCLMHKKQKPKQKPKLVVLHRPTEEVIGTRYKLGRILDIGDFGSTCSCEDIITGEELACKSISKNELIKAIDIEAVRREVAIMRHLPKHPNIVTLKDTYEDDDYVYLVMEHCQGGMLFDRIVARGYYRERPAASIVKTIVQVVQMCHKHGVMHRNLKPENILFANNNETAPLKVTDFDLSIFFEPGETFHEITGSTYYMAPEVFMENYGPQVDIWSVGVILYILLCGVPPFWAETEQGVAQAIIRSVLEFKRDPWPKVSDNAKDLVKKMLDPDPKCRLTAQEVLDHPWLQNAKTTPDFSLGETARTRLMQFSVMNKLKKTALGVIADHLSVEEVAGIKERFHVMDTENNGKININELRVGLQKLGYQISDADVQILMEAADVDKDGYLDYGEFVATSINLGKIFHDEHLHIAFQFFDKNESGYIELEELRNALTDEIDKNSEQVINAIMHDVDTDKDGKISYEEFVAMMKAGTDWSIRERGERFNQIVGSPYYMAPDVLKRNYGPEVDIWNAGAILYILLCGDAPFWAESEQGFAQAIIQSVIDFKSDPWPKVSENAKDLVKKMLDPDPKTRLTAQEVLDHPWLIKLVKKISNDTKVLVKKMLDPTLEMFDELWLWKVKTTSLGETIRTKLIQFSVTELTKTTATIIAEQLFIEVDAKRDKDFVIDTGNKGKINFDELQIRLHKLDYEIPDGNVQGLMVAFDEDKDGYLDYGEFLAICIHLRKISNEKHINKAFEYFDKNQSGYIDLKELCYALGDKVDMDTYKDGKISYEEVWS